LQLLRAIERSRSHLPLRTVLRVIGLSHARYHDLLDASKRVTLGKPMLLVDGGVENLNSAVDEVVESGLLKRVPCGLAARRNPFSLET
jgi:hypothetical protein